jgi:hypothetical protein
MNMKTKLSALLSILFTATLLLAHGDFQHVMGVITKITPATISVETSSEETVEVAISPDTKFLRGDNPVESRELKLGDRVVIHAKKASDGKLTAHTVQIGAAKPAAVAH